MPKFNPPEQFNFSSPNEWPEWKQRFSRFRIATKLNKEDGEIQVSSLIYAIGRQAEFVFTSFSFDNEEMRNNFDEVMKKFNEHFIPQRNTIHERAKFHLRIQRQGENVETFVRSLYELSEHCQFGETKDEMIRDRLVIGLTDKESSQKMQLERTLTLDVAIQMARQFEMVKSQISTQQIVDVEEIKKYGRPYVPKKKSFSQRNSRQKTNDSARSEFKGKCKLCNRQHGDRDDCPAQGKKCRKCHKIGHFEVVCRSSRAVHEITAEEENYFLGSITRDKSTVDVPWQVQLKLNGKFISFKIDTGADISVISKDTYLSLNRRPQLIPPDAVLNSPGGKLKCMGFLSANVTHKKKPYDVKLYIVEGSNNLLSRSAATMMGLVFRVEEVNQSIFGDFDLVDCEPVKITLKENAVPYAVHTSRRVPFPILPKVKEELMRMQEAGIIEEITTPTDWCAPMVPVIKKNGRIRICVDLKKLNNSVKRERYQLPTFDDIAPKLAGSTVFSKLDASSGFYQVPLDEASSHLTCFITPFGRYCFKRVPFGITSAPEIFQRKMNEMMKGLDGVEALMDDTLIYGRTVEEHDHRFDQAIRRITDSGMKLNKSKCEIRRKQLKYVGHLLTANGISPDPDKVKAILDLQAPSNVSELRHVMGMVNYLGRYLPELSTVMHPMSDLLKSDTVWSWGPSQEDSFKKIKEMITSAPVLVFYDPKKETTVSADASSYGLGAVLLQQHEDKLLPVAYCSRTLTSAETRYAQIEKECLAGVWACERFSQYLVGLESFHLLTDHRPLVPLINSLDLDRTPLRCQRLLMRLMRFNAKAEYVPGKKLVVADYLSRKPLPTTEEADTEVAMYVECAEESRPILDKMLRRIANSTLSDAELQAAVHLTRNGWPDQIASIPEIIKKFHSVRSELSTSNDLLLFRNRIVIPSSMRSDILRKLHEGHQGLTKCRGRASMTVWWPTINKDIQEEVATCQFCQESKPAQRKEPLVVTSLPERPWQKIAADLCELNGKRYLVMIDYYSRYIEIAYLTDMTSKQVIGRMKSIFARWGIPEELFSDNGTQFTAAGFQEFLNEYAIKHTTSSPTYPQANGEAEIAVKIAKSMLKQEDPFEALMSYRSTPSTATGISPAELIMGRKMRTKVPTLTQNLKPKWIKFEDLKEFDHKKKGSYRFFFNRRNSARPLPELRTGDHVRIREGKGWSSPAIIQSRTEEPISYWVKTKTNVLRRNRRHIMRIAVPSTASILPTDSTVLPCPVFSKPVPAVPDIDKPSISDPRPLQFESEAPAEDLLVPNGDVPDTTSPMPTTRSGRIVRKPVRFRDL